MGILWYLLLFFQVQCGHGDRGDLPALCDLDLHDQSEPVRNLKLVTQLPYHAQTWPICHKMFGVHSDRKSMINYCTIHVDRVVLPACLWHTYDKQKQNMSRLPWTWHMQHTYTFKRVFIFNEFIIVLPFNLNIVIATTLSVTVHRGKEPWHLWHITSPMLW